MIVASKDLKLSQIEALTSRDTTCINLHTPSEELILVSSYQDITFPEVINNIDKCVEHSKSVKKEIIISAATPTFCKRNFSQMHPIETMISLSFHHTIGN